MGLKFSRPYGTDAVRANVPALKRRAIIGSSRWDEVLGGRAMSGMANLIFPISRIDCRAVFGFHLRLQI